MHRRRFLLGVTTAVAGLAGCASREETNQTDPPTKKSTRTDSTKRRDNSSRDLKISNELAAEITIRVTFVPEGKDPKLVLTKELPESASFIRADISLFDEPGHITIGVEAGSGYTRQTEHDWSGDTVDDNHGLRVYVKEDEISIFTVVA
ncbi:twin-arginine translocation signal domain-containing protein [Haloparvum sp. PAK95]|uniref:twin-arginine translocation signal domain-containing protein n=1 Tax=Haloparvum sp. PAK95 TaxID=3418962 RepID=UPI003D2F41F3